MAKIGERPIFVLGSKAPGRLPPGGRFTRLRGRAAIRHAIVGASTSSAWLASDLDTADELVEEASEHAHKAGTRKHRLGNLILLEPPRPAILAPALDLFASLAWSDRPGAWLPLPDLFRAIVAPHPGTLIVGGALNQGTKTLTVYRGDFSRLTVPQSIFKPSGDGTAPDFSDFEVIDFGHAIRLGRYESSADAIFYEGDPEFRSRLRKRRREEERTFGASLRRLRIQRRLRQEDFPPLSARTIARIEDSTTRPRSSTLEVIARRLEVEPDAIETY